MQITEVNLTPIQPKDGLIGFASFVLNGSFYMGSVAIYAKPDGTFRLLYPAKKVWATNMDVFHPINREASKAVERAIFKKCDEIFNKRSYEVKNDRYGEVGFPL